MMPDEEIRAGLPSIFGEVQNVVEKYCIGSASNELHTKKFGVPLDLGDTGSLFISLEHDFNATQFVTVKLEGAHRQDEEISIRMRFFDIDDEVPYVICGENSTSVDTWWQGKGKYNLVSVDFGEVKSLKYILFGGYDFNPKTVTFIDGRESVGDIEDMSFHPRCYFQIGGKSIKDPKKLKFKLGSRKVGLDAMIKTLNTNPPTNGFQSVFSSCRKHLFVFHRQGFKSRAMRYYFGGYEYPDIVQRTNSITELDGKDHDDVTDRALSLSELRAVRSVIISNCVKDKWQSSRDGSFLRPDDVNLYDLSEIIINPLTKMRNCSFKELFPSGPAPPTFYCSHWWGEKVLDFIQCCEYHAMMHGLHAEEAKYWVCAYANRQHDLGADLSTNPEQSSFNRTIRKSRGVLMVVDPDVVVCSRIWVGYELFKVATSAINLDFIIQKDGQCHLLANDQLYREHQFSENERQAKFPFATLAEKFLGVELYKGSASREIDKIRILNVMAGRETLDDRNVINRIEAADGSLEYIKDMEKFSDIDWTLRAIFAEKVLFLVVMGVVAGQSLRHFFGFDLCKIISKAVHNQSLILDDWKHGDESITDDVLKDIADMLPKTLTRFDLNLESTRLFGGGKMITDEGIKQLKKFPDSITHFTINLNRLDTITDESLVHIARNIPPKTEFLHFQFASNETDEGYVVQRYNNLFYTMASAIPQTLKSLKLCLNLDGEEDGTGIIELVKALPVEVEKLDLMIFWDNIPGATVKEILRNLPDGITCIMLDFSPQVFTPGQEWDFNLDTMALANETRRFTELKYFKIGSLGKSKGAISSLEDLRQLQEELEDLEELNEEHDKEKFKEDQTLMSRLLNTCEDICACA